MWPRPRIRNRGNGIHVISSSGSSLGARASGQSGKANSPSGPPSVDKIIGGFGGNRIITSPKMEGRGSGERRLRSGMSGDPGSKVTDDETDISRRHGFRLSVRSWD
jgi:hypothetical protein